MLRLRRPHANLKLYLVCLKSEFAIAFQTSSSPSRNLKFGSTHPSAYVYAMPCSLHSITSTRMHQTLHSRLPHQQHLGPSHWYLFELMHTRWMLLSTSVLSKLVFLSI